MPILGFKYGIGVDGSHSPFHAPLPQTEQKSPALRIPQRFNASRNLTRPGEKGKEVQRTDNALRFVTEHYPICKDPLRWNSWVQEVEAQANIHGLTAFPSILERLPYGWKSTATA